MYWGQQEMHEDGRTGFTSRNEAVEEIMMAGNGGCVQAVKICVGLARGFSTQAEVHKQKSVKELR